MTFMPTALTIMAFISILCFGYELNTRLHNSIEACSPVASVGGCDCSGACGVKLENGRIQIAIYPVVGVNVCYFKAKK